jgi:Leucine-rich repeat (LRR) protein
MWISKFSQKETPPYLIRDDEHGIGKVFILKSPWSDSYGEKMRSCGINALRLPSDGFGFKAQEIGFIADLRFLKSVEIYTQGIADLGPLKILENIEVLGLEVTSAAGIEGWLPPLRVLNARWCKQLEPMLSIGTLEHVNISNYPFSDLRPLSAPRLRELLLTSRKLETLKGSADLPLLETVDLYNCPNLTSVEELTKSESMRSLTVEACRHISSKEKIVVDFA